MHKEIRYCKSGEIRAVEGENDAIVIEGYAIVWDTLSSYPLSHSKYGTYWERIDRHAFDDSLEIDDVACLFDHESCKILGRTSSKTLALSTDDHGLKFRCEVAPTSYGRDLKISIARGDIQGCSFGFMNSTSEWEDVDGKMERTITKASLLDVSPVTYPTYLDTEVALRSLNARETTVTTARSYLDLLTLRLRIAEKMSRQL